MSDWPNTTLGEVFDVRDGTHDSPKRQKQGFKLVTTKHLKDGQLDLESAYFISEKDFIEVSRRSQVNRHDILISMIGTVGEIFRVDGESDFAIKNLGLIKCGDKSSSLWTYYWLLSPQAQNEIKSRCKGTTQEFLSLGELRKFPLPTPSKAEQEAIAEVLSSLDDKIDLLKRQNKTLEGMAEALFRQWFLEESQDDWEEIELNKHLEFGSGFPFKSNTYLEQGQYRIATIKHVQDGFLDLSDAPFLGCLPEKIKPHCILNQGDVILSLTGNVGRCCMVDKDNVLLNQRVASILPYDGAQLPFWYFFFRYPATKGILDQLSHGTAQKNLSTRVLGFEKFQLPPTNEICSRVPAFKAIFDKILDNHKTMEILESQRDTLLPKLMSGEVRVQMD